jgi:hypothetical protein
MKIFRVSAFRWRSIHLNAPNGGRLVWGPVHSGIRSSLCSLAARTAALPSLATAAGRAAAVVRRGQGLSRFRHDFVGHIQRKGNNGPFCICQETAHDARAKSTATLPGSSPTLHQLRRRNSGIQNWTNILRRRIGGRSGQNGRWRIDIWIKILLASLIATPSASPMRCAQTATCLVLITTGLCHLYFTK